MAESAQQIREEIAATKSHMVSKLQTLEEKMSFGEQIHKHPWLSLGSAAAVGYLAAHFKGRRSSRTSLDTSTPELAGRNDGQETAVVGDTAIDAIPTASRQSKWSLSSAITHSMKAIVAQIVIEAAQRAVAQAVPRLIVRSMQSASPDGATDRERSRGIA